MTDQASSAAALELRDIWAGYVDAPVLRDVSVSLPGGSVTALLGPNGAGKTTMMRVIAGLLPATRGEILVAGEDVTKKVCHERVARGLCLIPEGRGIFRNLTVAENLALFRTTMRGKLDPCASAENLRRVHDQFPFLEERSGEVAGRLSGGQQQMLSLARAYMSNPALLLIDEASLGLAPIIVDEVYGAIRNLSSAGTTLVIVEQYVQRALDLADHVVLLQKGSIGFFGQAEEVDEDQIANSYLADGAGSGAMS